MNIYMLFMPKLLIVACLLFALPLSAGTITLTQDTVWTFFSGDSPIIFADDIDLNGHSLGIRWGDPFHVMGFILSGRVSGKGSLSISGLSSSFLITGPLDLDGPVSIAVGSAHLSSANHFHGALSVAEFGVRFGTAFVEDAGAIPAGTPLFLDAVLIVGPYSIDVSNLTGRANDIPGRVRMELGGGTLTVSGSGPSNYGGLINGYGKIIVTGDLHCASYLGGGGSFAGPIEIAGGTLFLERAGFSSTAPITVFSSGTLRLLRGGTGPVSVGDGAIEVLPDTYFDPTSSVTGELTLTSSSRFIATVTRIPFSVPMLRIADPITLGNSVLDYRPAAQEFPRDKVIIIRNEGSQPINGTFAGLPEGATFTANGGIYRINYHGGTGGDVIVTTVSVATGTTLSSEPLSSSTPQYATLHSLTRRMRSPSGTPAGLVTFSDGNTILGTVPMDSTGAATFRTPALQPGTHTLTARFTGSASDAPSTSDPLSYVVNIPPPVFRLTLTSSNNPSAAGAPVLLYAFVATDNGPSDGTVDFVDDSTTLATLAVKAPGGAAFTTAFAPGIHTLYAIFRPSNGMGGITSELLVQNVVKIDSVCSAPVIVALQANASISRGGSATLSVATRGDEPQRIEWFRGSYPDTASALGEGPSLTLHDILTTTPVWVRATNYCGSAYSAGTITVAESRRHAAR